jgi:proteic killer suppression protein
MEVRFAQDELERLKTDGRFTGGHSPAIVKRYRYLVAQIEYSQDEREFRGWPGLRFEKLEGKRAGQYSMRLNNQYRLILEFEGKSPKKVVVICEITDYH